jgi:hypothetical protein
MKTFFEGYPFCPKSGKIISSNDENRVERYYKSPEFEGDYFDITFEIKNEEDNAFSISKIKTANNE